MLDITRRQLIGGLVAPARLDRRPEREVFTRVGGNSGLLLLLPGQLRQNAAAARVQAAQRAGG